MSPSIVILVASPEVGVTHAGIAEAIERVEEEADALLFSVARPRPAHLPPRPADPSTVGYYLDIEIEKAWEEGRILVALTSAVAIDEKDEGSEEAISEHIKEEKDSGHRVEDRIIGTLFWRDLEEKHRMESSRAERCEDGEDGKADSIVDDADHTSTHIYKKGIAYISSLAVSPKCGRQGAGTRLLHKCIEQVAEEGYKEVWLTTFANVPFNAPWYTRQGFVLVERDEAPPILVERMETELIAYGMDGIGDRVIMKYTLEKSHSQ